MFQPCYNNVNVINVLARSLVRFHSSIQKNLPYCLPLRQSTQQNDRRSHHVTGREWLFYFSCPIEVHSLCWRMPVYTCTYTTKFMKKVDERWIGTHHRATKGNIKTIEKLSTPTTSLNDQKLKKVVRLNKPSAGNAQQPKKR